MADLSRPFLSLFCRAGRRFWWLLLFLLPAPAWGWEAVVVRVVDGDTLLVAPTSAATPGQAATGIRLYGIDAPEMRQQGGQAAQAALAALVAPGDVVDVLHMKSDAYDRLVGIVMCRGLVLNLEQIRSGQAWLYERYCRASLCRSWKKAEQEARARHRGLWSEENPLPPWDWRKEKKHSAPP